MKPIIEVSNLSKSYRINHEQKAPYHTLKEDITTAVANPFKRLKAKKRTSEQFWALKDINFSVNQGDVVGIIGHNGSGKSTLLKILSRIVEPTTGEVKLRGRVASLLEVGTGFHPELTGRENIYLNGAILGMKRSEIARKFDDIVEFSGVERFLDTPVKFYSSGMYVRLAFAVAAHIESDILLVDEVLSVGDADFQRKSLGKMNDITKGEGRTIIYVSHNMESVIALCNKVLLLDGGKIIDSGDVYRVINDYSGWEDKGEFQNYAQNRLGSQEVRIKKVTLQNPKNGKSTNTIIFGEPLRIEIETEGLTDKLKRGRVDINFFSEKGQQLICFTNARREVDLDPKRIIIEIPDTKLGAGNYWADVSLHSAKEHQDYIEKAFSLKVYPGGDMPEGARDFLIDRYEIKSNSNREQ